MKIRTLIKRVCAGVVGAGSSLIIAACYGVYYDDQLQLVYGKVTNQNGTGIADVQVCAVVGSRPEVCTSTYYYGEYSINMWSDEVDEASLDGFTLDVRDVDGALNGTYEDKDVIVPPGTTPAEVDVTLDGTP
mgnify:CR=1 FL=1|jgi:hypothetical protein